MKRTKQRAEEEFGEDDANDKDDQICPATERKVALLRVSIPPGYLSPRRMSFIPQVVEGDCCDHVLD